MASAAWQGKPSYAPGAVTTLVLGCPGEVSAVPLLIAVSSLGDAWWRPLTPTRVHMHRNTAVIVEGERGHGKGGQYDPTRCHEA